MVEMLSMLDILLVEDEPSIRIPIAEALGERGHHVAEVADGAAAMALLDRTRFHLVVTDVRLPKVDGFTILRRVRRESPETDVLLMTAYATVTDAVAAIREQAVDYVTKPFDVERLYEIVARVEERHGTRRELEQARARLAG